MPEVTDEMIWFANFAETYIEPAMYAIYVVVTIIISIVSALASVFVGMAG